MYSCYHNHGQTQPKTLKEIMQMILVVKNNNSNNSKNNGNKSNITNNKKKCNIVIIAEILATRSTKILMVLTVRQS